MYQGIYYDNREDTIHVWDDEFGYKKEPFEKYAYGYKLTDKPTEYKSLFGQPVEKVYPKRYGRNIEENEPLFESDVDHTNRYLIDNYPNNENVSKDFNVLTFDIETEMVHREIDVTNTPNAITSIAVNYSLSGYRAVYIVSIDSKDRVSNGTNVLFFATERDMLIKFLDDYNREDPRALSGWNTFEFDMPYIYNRISLLLGKGTAARLSPIRIVKYSAESKLLSIAGVTSFDYMFLYKKFEQDKKSEYNLEYISQLELGKGKVQYTGNLDDLLREDIEKYIAYNLTDVDLVLELDAKLKYIDLARLVCHMCKVTYDAITHSSRYIDGAILAFLKEQNVAAPNCVKFPKMRVATTLKKGSKKVIVNTNIDKRLPTIGVLTIYISKSKTYELEYDGFNGVTFNLVNEIPNDVVIGCDVAVRYIGGYVKDPIAGRHSWVASIDAKSEYPSLIRSLKISPESKVGKILEWKDISFTQYFLDGNPLDVSGENNFEYVPSDATLTFENKSKQIVRFNKDEFISFMKDNDLSIASNGALYAKDKLNCIPNILTRWFNLRVEYRKKAKESNSSDEYTYYDMRQYAIKILLNSVYGVLGMPGFRFYDLDNAEATTMSGQDLIKYTSGLIFNYYKKNFKETNTPIIYNDTDSVYFQIHKSIYEKGDVDEIIKFADFIASITNRGTEIFSRFALNTNNNCLEFNREKVCKTALFLAKKRYGLYVIDNEGKRVDKISVTGIDIKRSSFPKFFVTGLTRVLDSILKGDNQADTDAIILSLEKEIYTCNLLDICKTSSVKDLKKYELITDGFTFPKGVTAHGKAAVRYNRLLSFYKVDNKYSPISPAEKIKWCYLKDNTLGFDSIALKNDNVPDVIYNFANEHVDRKMMYDKELKNKILSFYDAINWKYPNQRELKAKKYF